MSSLSKVINFIKKDLYSEKNENPQFHFFYSSMLNYAISLEIASSVNLNKPLTFESICKLIPKKFGCRSSIKSSLDSGVYEGFFIKETNIHDKRVKSYKLSEEYSLVITNWYLSRKERHGF
jgi:hypothetical protein